MSLLQENNTELIKEDTEKVSMSASKDSNTQPKRLVFSNEHPNSQGSIVRNNTIDFSRYNINPVLLANHDWKSLPIGKMTDIRLEANGDYTGIPVFHEITDESKTYSQLYKGGWLSTASIGGEASWRKDFNTGRFIKNEEGKTIAELNTDGFMESSYFDLFEISLPTLPSNPTAATEDALREAGVRFSVNIYNKEDESKDIENFTSNIELKTRELVELSTNNNSKTMAKKVEEPEATVETSVEAAKSETVETTAAPEKKVKHVRLGVAIPGWLENLIGLSATYAHPEGKYGDDPIVEQPKKTEPEQPKPTGLKAEEMTAKSPEKDAGKELVEKVKNCKAKMDEAEGEEEMAKTKSDYEAACKELDDYEAGKTKETKSATKMSAITEKPELKTVEEVKTEHKMAASPEIKMNIGEHKTFTRLSQDEDGKRIMGRIFNGSNEGKTISDYNVLLSSLMNDPKFKPLINSVRFHLSANNQEMFGTRGGLNLANRNNSKVGMTFGEVAGRLNSGIVNGINFTAGAKGETRTTLSTDGSFSSLDTVAVEWLSLIIFKLFPAESWKNEIPLFSAEQTGRNLGVIWTNITADPAIYRGTNPSPATALTYTDTAVGVKLVPYWLQPMRWSPLYMHQLRYNQQDSGWAQGLRKLEAQVGDDLLYTFGAGALANNQPIIYTNGPIDSTQDRNFTISSSANDINKFYFNSAFNGTLVKAGFNDVIAIEQLFNYLNFDLSAEKVVMVADSITESQISQDKQTQSMLTRWVNDSGADIQKIKHTLLHERSRVIAYDPAGGTVIDTHASGVVIPSTTQSCNLAFVPSQLGIALGLIDVFFVQNPANYGFDMAMDMRIGGRGLRSDYTGAALYAYGTGSQAGQ